VSDGGEGGGEPAVDPALLEVPERRDDQVILPRGSKPVLSSTRFQLNKKCNRLNLILLSLMLNKKYNRLNLILLSLM